MWNDLLGGVVITMFTGVLILAALSLLALPALLVSSFVHRRRSPRPVEDE